MKLSELGEFGLIEKIRNQIGHPGGKVIKGIDDDCAVVEISGDRVSLFTSDMLVEGVHFKKGFTNPANLGRKALAVNISDIAAMGGKPLYALLSLGAPETSDVDYIDGMISGMKTMAGEYGIHLVGGDTSLSPEALFISMFLVGESSKDTVLYRSGTGPEQVVFVTGEVGSSAAGLDILRRVVSIKKYASLMEAHLTPRPHVKEGEILASSGLVTSLIDVSDGVIADLRHICEGSRVGAIVRQMDLPISEECRQYCDNYGIKAEELALFGGEDYVLLGTVPEHAYYELRDLMKSEGCSIFPIGRTKPGGGIRIQNKDGDIIKVGPVGYDHFKGRQV